MQNGIIWYATAKFWIQYVHLIHLYRNFKRSARDSDLDLHVSCLPQITNIYFAMKDLIYPKWLVKYDDSLTKLPDTHP